MPTICCSRSFHSLPEQADQVAHARRQVRLSVLEDIGHRYLELERSLREHQAALQQERSQLVDYGRSSRDETIAHTMDGLQVQLVVRLDRDETHVLPADSLRDGLGIEEVVLVRLHERPHELSRDQLHIMALLSQGTAEEVSPRTRFHTNQRALHVGGEGNELLLRELLPQQHLARCAQSYEVKRRLAKIDTNRMNLHVDDPP
jgi:hypothetical protein